MYRVWQGCAVAPKLFNVIIDFAKTTSRPEFGLRFGDRILSDADFADDLVFMVKSMTVQRPKLFNVIIDFAKTTSRPEFGLRFGDRILSDADIADDLVLMVKSMI